MVNILKNSKPIYWWNNLKEGTYTFKFLNIGEGEYITWKHHNDYFKYQVEFIWSNMDFYGVVENQRIELVLPSRGFEIGINLYKDRTILNRLKDDDVVYITIFKKKRKMLRILDISISKPKEIDLPDFVPEEVIM